MHDLSETSAIVGRPSSHFPESSSEGAFALDLDRRPHVQRMAGVSGDGGVGTDARLIRGTESHVDAGGNGSTELVVAINRISVALVRDTGVAADHGPNIANGVQVLDLDIVAFACVARRELELSEVRVTGIGFTGPFEAMVADRKHVQVSLASLTDVGVDVCGVAKTVGDSDVDTNNDSKGGLQQSRRSEGEESGAHL